MQINSEHVQRHLIFYLTKRECCTMTEECISVHGWPYLHTHCPSSIGCDSSYSTLSQLQSFTNFHRGKWKKKEKKKSVRDLFPDRALTKLSQLSVLRWHTTAVLLLVPHNESVTSSKMLPAGNWNSKFTFANPGLDGCTKITVFVNTKSTTYTEIIDKWSKEAKAL